ncbi:hypothetical protein J437_LFUL003572 [Ladona fulva]|uniref:Uncharacterized protein n=1 Tax=Ladona fulva TaxID=123851 RepID=A0A8K0NV97_LADFU|nr:hypothetical protein J437_LFUL003572 [Ladona fulva]
MGNGGEEQPRGRDWQAQLSRLLHTLKPALGIELTTRSKSVRLQEVAEDGKSLRLVKDGENKPPLVILLPWLMSKQKHLRKYVDYYMKHGFDVVIVRTTPNQLMWPAKGANPIAEDFVTFLQQNPEYDRLLVHGFSVGGYMWAATLIRLLELGKTHTSGISPFDAMAKRVQGLIWDSVCDFDGLPSGVSRSIFTPGSMLCNALESYLTYHLKVFYDVATQYYIRASQVFHSAPIRSPSLLLFSMSDPISTSKTSYGLYDAWTKLGMPGFLEIIGLISSAQENEFRMKARSG